MGSCGSKIETKPLHEPTKEVAKPKSTAKAAALKSKKTTPINAKQQPSRSPQLDNSRRRSATEGTETTDDTTNLFHQHKPNTPKPCSIEEDGDFYYYYEEEICFEESGEYYEEVFLDDDEEEILFQDMAQAANDARATGIFSQTLHSSAWPIPVEKDIRWRNPLDPNNKNVEEEDFVEEVIDEETYEAFLEAQYKSEDPLSFDDFLVAQEQQLWTAMVGGKEDFEKHPQTTTVPLSPPLLNSTHALTNSPDPASGPSDDAVEPSGSGSAKAKFDNAAVKKEEEKEQTKPTNCKDSRPNSSLKTPSRSSSIKRGGKSEKEKRRSSIKKRSSGKKRSSSSDRKRSSSPARKRIQSSGKKRSSSSGKKRSSSSGKKRSSSSDKKRSSSSDKKRSSSSDRKRLPSSGKKRSSSSDRKRSSSSDKKRSSSSDRKRSSSSDRKRSSSSDKKRSSSSDRKRSSSSDKRRRKKQTPLSPKRLEPVKNREGTILEVRKATGDDDYVLTLSPITVRGFDEQGYPHLPVNLRHITLPTLDVLEEEKGSDTEKSNATTDKSRFSTASPSTRSSRSRGRHRSKTRNDRDEKTVGQSLSSSKEASLGGSRIKSSRRSTKVQRSSSSAPSKGKRKHRSSSRKSGKKDTSKSEKKHGPDTQDEAETSFPTPSANKEVPKRPAADKKRQPSIMVMPVVLDSDSEESVSCRSRIKGVPMLLEQQQATTHYKKLHSHLHREEKITSVGNAEPGPPKETRSPRMIKYKSNLNINSEEEEKKHGKEAQAEHGPNEALGGVSEKFPMSSEVAAQPDSESGDPERSIQPNSPSQDKRTSTFNLVGFLTGGENKKMDSQLKEEESENTESPSQDKWTSTFDLIGLLLGGNNKKNGDQQKEDEPNNAKPSEIDAVPISMTDILENQKKKTEKQSSNTCNKKRTEEQSVSRSLKQIKPIVKKTHQNDRSSSRSPKLDKPRMKRNTLKGRNASPVAFKKDRNCIRRSRSSHSEVGPISSRPSSLLERSFRSLTLSEPQSKRKKTVARRRFPKETLSPSVSNRLKSSLSVSASSPPKRRQEEDHKLSRQEKIQISNELKETEDEIELGFNFVDPNFYTFSLPIEAGLTNPKKIVFSSSEPPSPTKRSSSRRQKSSLPTPRESKLKTSLPTVRISRSQ